MVMFRVLILSFLCVGCTAQRVAVTSQRDSISVAVHQRDVLLRDTVTFEIEPHKQEFVGISDSSFLENPYATSQAVVRSDGTLHHTLESKAQSIEQSCEMSVEVRDSVVYRDRVRVEQVEVERELSWLEQLQIHGFRLLALLLGGGLLVRRLIG